MNQARENEKPRIGITIGDLNGIGPEIILKTLSDNRITSLVTPVIYGQSRVLSFYKKMFNLEEFNYSQVKQRGQYNPKQINIVNCWEEVIEIKPGEPSKESGRVAGIAIREACNDLKAGLIDALVTAPVDKSTVNSAEMPFDGHTSFLTKAFELRESLMILAGENMRVGLVSEHVPLSKAASLVTKERIEAKLKIFDQTLKQDFGINKPKIAVLGLNPHAGDQGLIGEEEEKIIKPVIIDLKNKGKLVFGPFAADGFFASDQYLKYDGILAMYHDQGLIGFKALSFETGVNYTAGLPVIRTSPDHGTAYNIAGKNQANENSFRQAIFFANEIVKTRLDKALAS
ncbi:MAG TPA: 4-hydroxythreonine-4-phosphate dehydrogenase PdxA [Cyclobacteriaceae bacterium]|nr:4-hydroxythreonine-4-phosphate dehydrogenase PdxA [Cyclobacteriaceae bacterium]